MTLVLTEEQEAIISAVRVGSGNLLVNARAGSAKTTTLIKVAEAIPDDTILSLAFNKKIKDEMRERMPGNVSAMTMNGIGLQAWRKFIQKSVDVDTRKNYFMLRDEIAKLERKEASEAWERFAETLKAISKSKLVGYVPGTLSPAYRILTDENDFYGIILEFEATDLQRELINRVAKQSWRKMFEGVLDFDDMLLGPAVAGAAFDYYDTVLVDEAQDLSMIDHVLLKKIVRKNTRIIAVGDPCQAIYGFRGADTSSMQTLGKMFDMATLTLTTSFRCSQAVTENARWRAPDMRWPDWAKPGLVFHATKWSAEDIPDGTAIICRNNAPLFALAIALLRDGRYPELAGRDIVKALVTKMKKLGKKSMKREHALTGVDAWLKAEKLHHRDHRLLEDQASCMRIFVNETDDLGGAIAFAEHLAGQDGRIYLMTGHRAKGLEFRQVMFLDSFLCRKDKNQDNNIKYVIETRAIDDLIYVTSETYEMKGVEDVD